MSEDDKSAKSNWWNSLMESAKEKSKNAFEVIKGDLAEFKTTMSNDASNLFLTSQVSNSEIDEKEGSSIFRSFAKSFNEVKNNFNLNLYDENNILSTETNENDTKPVSSNQERLTNEIDNLKCDENTYTLEPTDPDFHKWMEKFDPDEFKEEISKLLIGNTKMRLIYSKIVPANLSNSEFWGRYFFRLNILKEDQMKRIKLIEKINQEIVSEKEIDWGDDDENEEKSDQKIILKDDSFKNKNQENEIGELKQIPTKGQEIFCDDETKVKNDGVDEWEKITINENEIEKVGEKNNLQSFENSSKNSETMEENENLILKRESLLNKIEKNECMQEEADWDEWE